MVPIGLVTAVPDAIGHWSYYAIGSRCDNGAMRGDPTLKSRHSSERFRTAIVLGSVALAAAGARTHAQDMEPRAYGNTPVGLNFLIGEYGYMTGAVATDPSVPLENANIHVHSGDLAFARALNLDGRAAKLDVVLPYSWLDGTAELQGQSVQRQISGLGDPRLRLSVLLYGAPPLTLREFAAYQQDIIIGVSVQVSAPLGQYDANKLVNIGTHRWAVQPELGISKRIGPWTLELALAASVFETNDEFLGGKSRAQDPIYSAQAHVIFNTRSGVWFALDGTLYTGGRTTVDGVRGDDLQRNSRLGVTVTLPVNVHNSIKLNASAGVSTRTGSDFDSFGIAWQHRWGGGL